jgi:surface polysaccharide O-acyltransferase-like enzyme
MGRPRGHIPYKTLSFHQKRELNLGAIAKGNFCVPILVLIFGMLRSNNPRSDIMENMLFMPVIGLIGLSIVFWLAAVVTGALSCPLTVVLADVCTGASDV